MGARSIDLCKSGVFFTARERIGKAKISVSDGAGDCLQEKGEHGEATDRGSSFPSQMFLRRSDCPLLPTPAAAQSIEKWEASFQGRPPTALGDLGGLDGELAAMEGSAHRQLHCRLQIDRHSAGGQREDERRRRDSMS